MVTFSEWKAQIVTLTQRIWNLYNNHFRRISFVISMNSIILNSSQWLRGKSWGRSKSFNKELCPIQKLSKSLVAKSSAPVGQPAWAAGLPQLIYFLKLATLHKDFRYFLPEHFRDLLWDFYGIGSSTPTPYIIQIIQCLSWCGVWPLVVSDGPRAMFS